MTVRRNSFTLLTFYMKLKTHKALAKRVNITKTGKVLIRTAGQDHFNSREPGKVTRNKRRDHEFSDAYSRAVKTLIPNK